ncbi:MAG TPA: dethiobiotin synthase [Chitinophagaceae bacterium]|nr:dethiobiotin synthase [Chitinophagaceae bacterium]
MTQPIFITGIGTGIGKTLVAAIVAEALQADYWKPVQAGYQEGTDSNLIKEYLSNSSSVVHPELYKLKMAVSPHIAAREENIRINIAEIKTRLEEINGGFQHKKTSIIIEGAGGLMVPLNDHEFVADLIKQLQAKVILVSRNYLGSINHSLLTAEVCRYYKLEVLGWIFNDQFLAYEDEIVQWSGFPKIGTVSFTDNPGKKFIKEQALLMEQALKTIV